MVAVDSQTGTMLSLMRGELLEAERVHSIVGAFFTVYNYYGYGLGEATYAGALEYELIDRGHDVVRELLVAVSYEGRHVGWQRVDMVVDRAVIVENKATEKPSPAARPQLISYLRSTPFQVGVLLHFGPHPKFYRFIDFPKRSRNLIRARSSNSCPHRLESTSAPILDSAGLEFDLAAQRRPSRDTNDANDRIRARSSNSCSLQLESRSGQ